MATLDAAHAIGMQDTIGSLRAGKKADIVAVALDTLETSPVFDPASHLVYVTGREHVSTSGSAVVALFATRSC